MYLKLGIVRYFEVCALITWRHTCPAHFLRKLVIQEVSLRVAFAQFEFGGQLDDQVDCLHSSCLNTELLFAERVLADLDILVHRSQAVSVIYSPPHEDHDRDFLDELEALGVVTDHLQPDLAVAERALCGTSQFKLCITLVLVLDCEV